MNAYWLEFTDGSKGCCEGYNARDAKAIAEKVSGKKVTGEPATLPYPASPAIWRFDHPVSGKCPTFCMSPEKCKGSSACPRSYSCTE